MYCKSCHLSITPGIEISLDPLSNEMSLCPYCLHILPSQSTEKDEDPNPVSVRRFTMRRMAREQFVDRLLKTSTDGQLPCPVCFHPLNKNDEIILRNSEYFKCHRCSHDLAAVAYRKNAYQEQRWLPVIHALGDLKAEKSCASCIYLGAMAKACQRALSWMETPHSYSSYSRLISTLLAQSNWVAPDQSCCASCYGVRQYQDLAGEGLILL